MLVCDLNFSPISSVLLAGDLATLASGYRFLLECGIVIEDTYSKGFSNPNAMWARYPDNLQVFVVDPIGELGRCAPLYCIMMPAWTQL